MTRRLLHLVTVGLMALAGTLLAGAASAQNISVTAAAPNAGPQGTVSLLVKISGKNFAPGARTDFFLSGSTNPGGIVVHGTQWVSATEVDATIDIADTASLAYFDIRVTNTTGRSGKGSDMFQVVQKSAAVRICAKSSTCPVVSLSVQLLDTDALNTNYPLRSDGHGLYSNGVDNVTATFDEGGRFSFDTGIVLPAIRDMISNYTSALPGSSAYSLLVQPGAHYSWLTNGVYSVAPQELGTPGFPISMCKDGYIVSEDSFESYSTLYHTGIETGDASVTGRWMITRVGPTTWTVETSPTCGGDVVNLRHRIPNPKKGQVPWTYETIGYYHLPFKLILNTQ